MRRVRALAIVAALAVAALFAAPAPAGAVVCIENPVICCGTVYVNGKPIQVIPITC